MDTKIKYFEIETKRVHRFAGNFYSGQLYPNFNTLCIGMEFIIVSIYEMYTLEYGKIEQGPQHEDISI